MNRRQFVKDSAIVGASIVTPNLLTFSSGLAESHSKRKVAKVLTARKSMVQEVSVLRAFAGDKTDFVSPFVLLDEFGPIEIKPNSSGFKIEAHPHAGVTPTTYLLSGSGHHKDSIDNDITYKEGQYMMFSSGRGAIHMEESSSNIKKDGGIVHGFQIWLNIPSKYKFIDPTTSIHGGPDLPTINKKGSSIKVVLGELFGKKSSVELLSPAFYYHIKMEKHSKLTIPTDPTHNAFAYFIKGNVEVEGRKNIKPNQIVLYERGASEIDFFCQEDCEFLLLGGLPLNEHVYSYGPFVMNTKEQIEQCYANYYAGKMGKL